MSILFISTVLLGAFCNRVRGGLKPKFIQRIDDFLPEFFSTGRLFNDIVFAFCFSAIIGSSYQGFVDGSPYYSVDFSFILFLLLGASMAVGRSQGWGAYIGNMIRKNDNEEREVEWIDKIARKFPRDKNPLFKNTLALSIRGMVWSFWISFACSVSVMFGFSDISVLGILLFALSGFGMGIVYLFAIEIQNLINRTRNDGWASGEWLFGGWLWGAFLLCMV